MLRLLSLGCALIAAVNAYASDCQYNKKGDYYCNQRVAAIRNLPNFNTANPALPIAGNLCTSAANDGGLFRWELCCKACKEFLGGGDEAVKENSYVNTAPGEVCADKAMALTLCQKYATMAASVRASFCSQAAGRQYCPSTCNLCSTVQTQHTTLAACIGGTKCTNTTTCNRYSQDTNPCTTTGEEPAAEVAGSPPTPAVVVNQGKCNCIDNCVNYLGNACNNDTTCGGAPHSCQATKGKCACPTCTPNMICFSDNDCGGYYGTCGNIVDGKFEAITVDGTAFGKCLACPGSTPCRSEGTDCTAEDAAKTCGHAEYCVSPTTDGSTAVLGFVTNEINSYKCVNQGDCKCVCSTDYTKANDGTIAPVCIDGLACGNQDTELEVCGYGSACRDLATGGPCTEALDATSPKCKCNCTGTPTTGAPNACLGASTMGDGSPRSCNLALPATGAAVGDILTKFQTDDECGFKQTAASPYLWNDVCLPDMSTGQCSCMMAITPTVTSMSLAPQLTVKCTSSADCQTANDKSAVCAVVDDSTKFVGSAPSGVRCDSDPTNAAKVPPVCLCVPAHALVIDPATYSCITDADCGWGTCMTKDMTAPCTETDKTSTACVCQPAGCAHDAVCGINYSEETCGGYANACEGKCYCG